MFDESKSPAMQDLTRAWQTRGGNVVTGLSQLPETRFAAAILSPGVDPQRPVVRQLQQAGVPILGELELGARACLCPIVAVTGTNGKSTTTELIHEIYQAAGKKSVACGNLGRPICEVAPLTRDLDRVVAEVSSFQLESIETFHPKIAVYLNLTPDHLDRYASMREYGEAKLRLFANQTGRDTAVVQRDLALPGLKAATITFTAERSGADYTLEEGWLCAQGERVFLQEESPLRGPHNAENLLAALAVADADGIPRTAVKQAFRSYRPLPHRCEVVAVRHGVNWVNDSKATNPDAMERAVMGMKGAVILIAGGKDKGFDFSPSRKVLEGKVRAVLLLGEVAGKIEKAWGGWLPCRRVADLGEAVVRAAEMARAGETVLLIPGSSSYDMFKNFEERGEIYRQCVKALPKEETTQ